MSYVAGVGQPADGRHAVRTQCSIHAAGQLFTAVSEDQSEPCSDEPL